MNFRGKRGRHMTTWQSAAKCGKLLQPLRNLKTTYDNMWGMWSFCGSPVCPDPVWKLVSTCNGHFLNQHLTRQDPPGQISWKVDYDELRHFCHESWVCPDPSCLFVCSHIGSTIEAIIPWKNILHLKQHMACRELVTLLRWPRLSRPHPEAVQVHLDMIPVPVKWTLISMSPAFSKARRRSPTSRFPCLTIL